MNKNTLWMFKGWRWEEEDGMPQAKFYYSDEFMDYMERIREEVNQTE